MKLSILAVATAVALSFGGGQASAQVSTAVLEMFIFQGTSPSTNIPEVIISAFGSVDTSDASGLSLEKSEYIPSGGEIDGALGLEVAGAAGEADFYTGIRGPFIFGGGPLVAATAGGGPLFGVEGCDEPIDGGEFCGDTGSPNLILPAFYKSGSFIQMQSVFQNETIASLHLIPAAYFYNWGTGVDPTLEVHISVSRPVPEPATWTMMTLGIAALGFARFRQARSMPKQSVTRENTGL